MEISGSTQTTEAGLLMALDPVAFGQVILGMHEDPGYTPQQIEILEAIAKYPRVSVHAGHNVGKTLVAADVVLWWISTRWPSKVITTAPTARQVNSVLWAEIRARYHSAAARDQLPGELLRRTAELQVSDDHFALGVSTDDINRFTGFHSPNLLVVIDEAGGVDQEIWTAIEGLCSGGGAKILAIGNPHGPSGPFYEACRSAEWHTLRMSSEDHPNVIHDREIYPGMVNRSWVESRKREWGENSPLFKARVQGIFPEEAEDTLIPLSWVEDACQSAIPDLEGQPVAIGVDVARFGANETVFSVLRGQRQIAQRVFTGKDLMRTSGEVMNLLREYHGHPIRTVVDDDGLGGGVTDRLREQHQKVIAFRGGAASEKAKDRFVNQRAEAWWGLREALREHQLAIVDDDTLKAQLTAPRYGFRSDGRIEIEKKDAMADRGIPSPDRADALVLALWGTQNQQKSIRIRWV